MSNMSYTLAHSLVNPKLCITKFNKGYCLVCKLKLIAYFIHSREIIINTI